MQKLGKLLLIIFSLTLLSSLVTADITDYELYLNLTGDDNDETGNHDFAPGAAPESFGASGMELEADNSDYVLNSDTTLLVDGSNFTYCFQIKPETVTGTSVIYDERNTGSVAGAIIRIADSTGAKLNMWNTGIFSTTILAINVTYDVCFSYETDDDNNTWYVDSSSVDNVGTGIIADASGGQANYLGSYGHVPGSSTFDGYIKEFCGWNYTLTTAQINEYMTTSSCDGSGLLDPSPPTINLNTSLLNYTNSSLNPHTFILTTSSMSNVSNDVWNISVYYNNTLNQTHLDIAGLNSTGFTMNLTYGALQLGYDINITVEHGTDDAHDNIKVFDVFLDSVNPTLVLLSSNFLNNSIYYIGVDTTKNLNLTLTDNNLFYGNFSLFRIINDTNYTLLNTQNLTNIQTTSVVLNLSFNVNNILNGSYIIDGFVADAHTQQAPIKPVTWYSTPDTIILDNEIYLSGSIKEELTELYLAPEGDKYKFKITWDVDALNHELTIKADNNLQFIPNSKYKGHFVYMKLLRWIDFDNDNIKNLVVTDLGNNEYKLNIELYTISDEIEFESIGSLNTVNQQWNFNVSYGMVMYANDSITNTDIKNFTVELYNTTGGLVRNKTTTGGNVTFNITSGNYIGNYTADNYVDNSSGTVAFSINGFKTTYLLAANSLYLFIYDEQANALITRTVTLDVINYENTSSSYTTTTGSTFQSGFAAGSYEINYKAANYTARSYYTTIVGSQTQTINLYLLNDTDDTHQYLNYDIVDESASPLVNATLKMQRYFISDSLWQTVEMSVSNDIGQGFVFSELYDVTYRFIIEYPFGTTKKITSNTKLDPRDLFFSISLLDVGLTNFYDAGAVATTLTYSNTTKIWTYSFNAATLSNVTQGRFLVTKIDPNLITTVCNSTVLSNSGGMTCNLTSYSSEDSTFLAQGYITFTSDNLEYLIEGASLKVTEAHLTYGFNGLYLSFIVVGTMAFIGLFSPQISIVMALFGLVITNVLGLLYLNSVWLIGLIIVGIIYIFSLKR